MEIADYQSNITPLRYLIRQAGWHGYLLLAASLLSLFTSRHTFRGRLEYDVVDNSAIIQVIYTILIFISSVYYLILPCGKQVWTFLLSRPTVYLLLYIMICIFSFLWSEKPLYSAFMGFQCLAFLMLLTVILVRLRNNCRAQDIVEWMMLWMVWEIFWGVMFRIEQNKLYYTIFATGRLQTGILFFLAIYISKRNLLRWTVIAFALFSGSNKMYAGMIPGSLLGIFSESRKIKLVSSVGTVALISVLIIFGLKPVLQETVFRGRAGVGWEYTSGRGWIWKQSLDLVMERPFLGYGFVSGERDSVAVNISVHNMMLSAALSVGIIGPLLLFLYFLETTVLCFGKKLPRDWLVGFLATIGIAFVFSMTGPGLGGRVYGSWVATVFVMTMICMICHPQKSMDNEFQDTASGIMGR